jgi:threonine dehydrogenase-like Zn-dependent dehydrogenase
LAVVDGQLTFLPSHPVATPGDGQVRVRPIQAGICETDLQLVQGYMGFSGVLGHEFVGIAESGPWAGERVVGEINCICEKCAFCDRGLGNHCPNRTVIGILNHDGAFAESLIVPQRNLHRVPAEMSNDLATLVEPAAAALQILEQIEIVPNQRSVVLGDGRLGNLCAQVLKSAGCDVLVVGKHQQKLARIEALDIATIQLGDAEPAQAADVVVDCTGSTTGLETALSLVRPRGTVVLKTTVAGVHELSLAPVVINEITLVGSRCGPFDKAIAALRDDVFQLDDFICGRYALDEYERAFAHARAPDALKVVFEIPWCAGSLNSKPGQQH